MNIRLSHWLTSIFMAFMFHLGLFVLVFSDSSQGALAEGKHGVEIDLGMLGDFGEQLESQVSKPEVAPVKKTEVEPLVAKVIKEKELEEKVIEERVRDEKVIETEEVQSSELVVFDDLPETTIDQQELKDLPDEPSHKEETVLVDKPVLADANELPKLEQKTTTQTQVKQTTGEASSLHNGGQSGVDQSYLAKLLAQLAQHKRYPLSSRKKAQEGIAVLDFEMSRTGRVLVSHIQKSSGFNALDKAVLLMLKRAEPFPPVPPDIKGEPIRFTLPIAFKLNG